jgi:uncharacterized damage-inducible protein DinB
MTPDTVKLLARYNAHANTEMGRVLAQLSDEEWNREMGGYYPSIRSLCSHVFISDFAWLRRYATLRRFAFIEHPIFKKNPVWGELLFPTFRDWEVDRKALDERFTKFADEVAPEDLPQRLRYQNFKGIEQNREFGGLVLHAFNHQTHHRGMIALYLDLLGKENDFSNLFVLL